MVFEGVGEEEGGGVVPPVRPAALEAEAPFGRDPEPAREGEERTGARRRGDGVVAATERLEEGLTPALVFPLAAAVCVRAGVELELEGVAGAGAAASAMGSTAAAGGSGGRAA